MSNVQTAATSNKGLGVVLTVALSAQHTMSKSTSTSIEVVSDGVLGDAHQGERVKHRSRVRRDPSQPNLRQVHLLHAELHDELAEHGFDMQPGEMGENVLTRGVALLDLPTGTTVHLGRECILEITGLRNPCMQLNGLCPGLMAACLYRTADGELIRKAGVMATVRKPGAVRSGDSVTTVFPAEPWLPLEPV